MKKKLIWCIPALAISSLAMGQTSDPQVIASGGDAFASANLQNSYTIGEMALVETYTNSGFILTQGFQQPWDTLTGIHDNVIEANGLTIFPNPSNGNFSITYQFDKSANVKIEIYDALGKLAYSEQQQGLFGAYRRDLNLGTYSNGIYFLRFIADNGKEIALTTKPITINR